MPEPKRRSRAAARPAPRRAPSVIAVNIGNSTTAIGLFRGDTLVRSWKLTSRSSTADELVLGLDTLLHAAGVSRHAGAVVCSVVPALTGTWLEALERMSGGTPIEVGPATAKGMPIRYLDKRTRGPDRIANAVGARRLHGTPAIVVDLGTATTFDCVSKSGAFLGGIIAPGVGTAAEALHHATARLPRVNVARPERALARTTEEALRAGMIWGAAGQVDALVRRLALEMRGTPHVIATGGWAETIAPECETINIVDAALTLKGMRLVWEENA